MTLRIPTVLILGAAGRLGSAAVQAFARAGWQVVAQRRPRPGTALAAPDAQVRWIGADVHDTRALLAATGPVDVVVHALNPAYTAAAWRRDAPPLMSAVIRAAHAAGALLLFPGNVYNFGAGMPGVLREDTPQRPTTVKGGIRVALERQLADAAARQGVRSVVIRAGDFFGGAGGTLLDRVAAPALNRGRMGWMAPLDVATPWAWLPDLARAFEQVARQRDRIDGHEVLHFAGHVKTGAQWREVLAAVARDAGWLAPGGELKVSRMPWPVIRLGGLFHAEWASLAEMRYLWSTPHRLDNSRFVQAAGPESHTPFDAAVRAALADCGLLGTREHPLTYQAA